ncbi:hypothetical protein PIB30_001395 [Stylosanthes scabra]|uniref:Uncharacterized protein n=1 Tax=Stylosanthes scabra TaxID=79078 RepID=A0ABU6YZJ0_9FABA|nr:hypothetical protein [Stylosanthes scabra]
MEKEPSHMEGFSPKLALVTIGGGKELEEKLVVRAAMLNLESNTFIPETTMQIPGSTSWAISTRFVGGIIMTYGDNASLMLPPKVAPIQGVFLRIEIGPRDVSSGSAVISKRHIPGK